jgi:hypothetical protein
MECAPQNTRQVERKLRRLRRPLQEITETTKKVEELTSVEAPAA